MGKKDPNKTEKNGSVLLIYGADEFLVAGRAKEIVNKFVPPDQQTFGLTIVDGSAKSVAEAVTSISRCLEAVRTVGFLSRKVVWLRGAAFLGNDALSKTIGAQEAVDLMTSAVRAGFPANNLLVVTAVSVNARSAFLKACTEAGDVIALEAQKAPWLRDKEAVPYAQAAFRKHGMKPANDVVRAFLSKVGTNTRQIEQEIAKLDVYLGERRDTRKEDIEAITSVSRENFAWDLQDAVGDRNAGKSLDILHRLLFQNEEPIGLVTFLDSRFRQLLIFREAIDEGWISVPAAHGDYTPPITRNMQSEVAAIFDRALSGERGRMKAYVESKLASQAAKFTRAELETRRQMIFDARNAMVQSSAPSQILIRQLIIKLCMKPGGRN